MNDTAFTFDDMTALLASFGAKPENWPQDKREVAKKFMADHQAALAPFVAEAEKLDAALNAVDMSAPSDLLSARILKAAKTTTQEQPVSAATIAAPANDRMGWHKIAAMLAVTFALGFAGGNVMNTGTSTVAPTDTDAGTILVAETDTAEDLAQWTESANLLGVDEIYSWVEDTDV